MVQRVSEATVDVAGERVAEIGTGLLALVGVGQGDGLEQARELARKLVGLRVFEDERGRMNLDLLDVGGALCIVSQFTLYGDTRKGRRPSFAGAAAPEDAEPLVDAVAAAAREAGAPVVTGRFRARMDVRLANDGPVTLLIETGPPRT